MDHTETNPSLFSWSADFFPLCPVNSSLWGGGARFLHISKGSWKLDITYVGSANKIDLIRTSFPPLDSHLHVHPFTLCINLSFKIAKSLHLSPLISYGISRYVLIPPSFWTPRVSLICCLTFALILLPKSREGFSKLMHCNDACPYFLTTFITYSHSRGSALQMKRLSSAKRRWDIEGHARVTRILVIFPWFFA